MDLIGHIGLAVAGLAAGCLNTLAGGGSLLTVPMLMLLGLPANIANATNRLTIVTIAGAGVVGFARAGAIERRVLIPVIVTSAIGSFAGAMAATALPPEILEVVLLVVMVTMAGALVLRPSSVVAPEGSASRWHDRRLIGVAALLLTGLYGGFVQAGVGFLLVAVLSGTLGFGIVPTNALKAVASLVFGAVSLTVFAYRGLVDWQPAALLAVYGAIGAMVGVKLALRTRPQAMRWVLFVAVVATTIAAALR